MKQLRERHVVEEERHRLAVVDAANGLRKNGRHREGPDLGAVFFFCFFFL